MSLSIPAIPLKTFIDVEASGLDMTNSYPIEIAWVDSLGNADNFRIRPPHDWVYWDPNAERIHGLSRAELKDGLDVNEAAARLARSLQLEDIISDAPDFDSFWVNRLMQAAGLQRDFRILDIREVFGEIGSAATVRLCKHLRTHPAQHRALPDAKRLADAYSASFCEHSP